MTKRIVALLVSLLIIVAASAQDFKRVQVTTKDGLSLKGKSGVLTQESISFMSGSGQKTYSLTDVNLIQAKEGKAAKWALYSGGGCLGIGLITSLTQGGKYNEISGETYDTGTLLLGSLIWAGLFAGVGAVVGTLADQWQIVYNRGTSSLMKNVNVDFAPNQYAGLNVKLTYKFHY